MRNCSIDDCSNKHEAYGWCHKHYVRWKKHGDPLKIGKPKSIRTKNISKCTIDGCDKINLATDLCRAHYLKNKRLSKISACDIDGCSNKSYVKGLCNAHYIRKSRKKPMLEKSWHQLSAKERLNKFIKVNEENQCWIWTGGKNKKGYGSLSYNGKTTIAHRLSYELYIGQIPNEMLICHHCDTPSCINPGHLFLGTNLDNSNDKFSKGRNKSSPGQRNGNSKLTDDQVRSIKKKLKNGVKVSDISKQYEVSETNISYIKKEKTWSHIHG